MNEYLRIFKLIENEAQNIITNNSNSSPEIEFSAVNLKTDLEPCWELLKKTAQELEILLKPCFEDLEAAEKVWESKPKICAVSQAEIMAEIGIISGKIIAIENLTESSIVAIKKEILSEIKELFTKLQEQYFSYDESKAKFKKNSLNIFEKNDLIKSLESEFSKKIEQLKELIKTNLFFISDELKIVSLENYKKCLTVLPEKNLAEIDIELNDLEEYLNFELLDNYALFVKLNNPINELNKNSMLGLSLENFNKTAGAIEKVTKNSIREIIENGQNRTNSTLEKIIEFYNNFLEKQLRYEQETTEQREQEKKWIETQTEQLNRIKEKISQINK